MYIIKVVEMSSTFTSCNSLHINASLVLIQSYNIYESETGRSEYRVLLLLVL